MLLLHATAVVQLYAAKPASSVFGVQGCRSAGPGQCRSSCGVSLLLGKRYPSDRGC